ncbi:MAG: hypothetical protein HYY51_02240 [Candidatus Magasanikbacteria bacterium]|nr:hypothetical protein [Candidatus Magasanikbacteria bacterium]
MRHKGIQHTIEIGERLLVAVPPLVPAIIIKEMNAALEDCKSADALDLRSAENVIVSFAKVLWPYRQAFEEIFKIYQTKMGHPLLKQKISAVLGRKYEQFVESGGNFQELRKGSIFSFFSHQERLELHKIIIDIECDIRNFTRQAVLHSDRSAYEKRILEFQTILDEIEINITGLRELADAEQEHPQLADEIREHVRAFEHGIALFGPSVNYEAVCRAREHFVGRRLDLRMRV